MYVFVEVLEMVFKMYVFVEVLEMIFVQVCDGKVCRMLN